jgi:hypothetical protein
MNGRQQAAIDHLKMVGRDVHRFSSYALNYGLTEDQIKQAIADGVQEAEGGRTRAVDEGR